MTDGRVLSGRRRLDLILGGGLLANGINMIVGLPGSGKTLLAQQYLFRSATEQHPGVYLSTVSEPIEKILRYGQTLEFFDAARVGSSVFYDDLGTTLNERGLPGVTERVIGVLKERRPGMIVIDSFKALRPYATDPGDYRRFLHELAARLSVVPTTSFWIGEYGPEEISEAPEFAVADAIIFLGTAQIAERGIRELEILKFRGSSFKSGRHTYRLSSDGISVFPRLADPVDISSYTLDEGRVSSGIPLLDSMFGDGYWPGASTLVAGPSGSGKTLMGLHFIFGGARLGKPGVIASLQENEIQLERICRGFGWSLQDQGVQMMYRTPVDVYMDEWVYELLDTLESAGARRVMIDSLTDLRMAAGDEVRFREYTYSLLQRLSRAGISSLMTQEVPELFGATRLSRDGISHLSDNVIMLQFLRGESKVKRAITVIKTRAAAHDPEIRQFEITPQGFVLGEPFAHAQSLS